MNYFYDKSFIIYENTNYIKKFSKEFISSDKSISRIRY